MAVIAEGQHENWSSRLGFILAAVGSAVGLGNVWRFPYQAGEGGGAAFVIVYLLFVFGIGVPVMIAEWTLGRRGRMSPPNAVRRVAEMEGRSPRWSIIGWMGTIGGFFVLSYYSVIAGMTVAYMVKSLSGEAAAVPSGDASQHLFAAFVGDFWALLGWHAVFMLLTVFVVARGITGGIEQAAKWLMPALFALLAFLVVYALAVGDAGRALAFLFRPDFSKLTLDAVLGALGQAFFSLSLALGSMMVYGAYVPREISLPRSALIVAGADTAVALLAGLAIFPIVFAYHLDPAQGMGLVFVTLPIAFSQMPGGLLVGGAFFLLLAIAALTSSISLLEPLVSWLEEHRGISRAKGALIGGGGAFALGILSVLSFNGLADVTFWRGTFLDNLDFLTNNVLMPVGGLLIALFVGWMMAEKNLREELPHLSERLFRLYRRQIAYVAPIALLAIFFNVSGAQTLVLQIISLAGYGVPDEPWQQMLHATVVAIVVFLPTLIAIQRRHPQAGLFVFTNAVAGWTPVGWLFCLYWAHRTRLLVDEDEATSAG
ncbi:MAG: sodium-dependent transporter [Rhodothalassiaceae bacterium]|nr:MAG: sodium-dependent transporter [Rhodothalassiaceae bacterium]